MGEKEIAEEIKIAGGQLYLVGGAVRDSIIGNKNHDKDYCVVGITEEVFKKLFPQSIIRGKSFKVFDIDGKEFAIARKERKIGIGHKQFEIETSEKITLQEDLARRDLTINSMAKNVLTGEIVDPYNGIEDIKNKIIKATTESFKEDPLRVYRAARFAATLGFAVEPNTIKFMNELKPELITLSKERVFEELKKALSSDKPSIFFETLQGADVLQIHFKEIYDLIGALQDEKFHPEGDAYNHTMLVLDYAATQTKDLSIRFSALVHDLGKGVTPEEEYPHHYNHEVNGIELVTNLCKRVGIPRIWEKCGKVACREHMRGGIFYKMKPGKKVDFIQRVARSPLGLEGLQIVVNSDKLSSRNIDLEDINFEKIGQKCLNEIDGKYIKNKFDLNSGEEFGRILRQERIRWITEFAKVAKGCQRGR